MSGHALDTHYRDMTYDQFATAVARIIRSSDSEEQVRERLVAMGYPHDPAIHVMDPDSEEAREARAYGMILGGVKLTTGHIVMFLGNAPDGEIVGL
jgi:hypothetical protein